MLVSWSIETEARAQSTKAIVITRLKSVREPPLLGMETTIVWEILHSVLVTITALDKRAQSTPMAGLVVVAIFKIII